MLFLGPYLGITLNIHAFQPVPIELNPQSTKGYWSHTYINPKEGQNNHTKKDRFQALAIFLISLHKNRGKNKKLSLYLL